MRLIEADGKHLLGQRGLSVPRGQLYGPGEPVAAIAGGGMVKAQLLAGGRGKTGLVRLANEPEIVAVAATIADRMRALGVPPHILIEEKIAIEAECYLAWRIDDVRQAPVMLFSTRGGVEIEAHAGSLHEFVWDPLRSLHPHHLVRFLLDAGASRRALGALARFATELYRLFVAEDAELIEINPLAVTQNGQVTALDAKLVLDDNARFRHVDWDALLSAQLERSAMTPLERRAADSGLTLVELDGCVAVFAAGAGFGMALVDLLADAGMPAANFADASGGASPEAFAAMGDVILARAARSDVKAIVCYQNMSGASLKAAVDGLLGAWDRAPVKKPLVVGFAVSATSQREMTAAEARSLCGARGHHVIADIDELIPTLRRIIQP
jgi:succinyl-CoA synthetase beta subunit